MLTFFIPDGMLTLFIPDGMLTFFIPLTISKSVEINEDIYLLKKLKKIQRRLRFGPVSSINNHLRPPPPPLL